MLEDEKILTKHWGSKWSSQNDNWITHLCRYIRFKLIYIRRIIVSNYSERVSNSSYLTKFWISFWVGGGELRRSRTTKIQDSCMCIETFICFMALSKNANLRIYIDNRGVSMEEQLEFWSFHKIEIPDWSLPLGWQTSNYLVS